MDAGRAGRLPGRDRRRGGPADRAGRHTRALGLLPAEEWRSFARTADTARLGAVLDTFVFDAPAPWFDPQVMTEAVETGGRPGTARMPPPRPVGDADPTAEPEAPAAVDQDAIRSAVEELLATRDFIKIEDVLRVAPDWASARRVLAQLTPRTSIPRCPTR